MATLEQISSESRHEPISSQEKTLLNQYMPTNPSSAKEYNNCETCNNCGSGDCSSCCAETDD